MLTLPKDWSPVEVVEPYWCRTTERWESRDKEQHLELRQYLDVLKRKTVFVSVFKKNPRRWLSSEAVTIAARRPSSPLHWHHTVDICYYSKSTCAFETYFILRGKTF